jgi:TM2 domain-containing membrane protein YozV
MNTAQPRKQSLVWGSLLVFFGIAGLLQLYLDLDIKVWAGVFAAGGIVMFLIFLTDRSDWWPLIPTYILLAIAGLLAVIAWNVLVDDAIATYVMLAIALPFVVVYLRDRKQWWALIPAYVMVVIAFIILFSETGGLPDYLVGTFVLVSIGLPFLVVYLLDRTRWWALIPAYAMFSISAIIPLSEVGVNEMLIPAYVMFAIAVPFLFVYLRDRTNWWALIPGGIMTLIGVIMLLSVQLVDYLLPIAIILVGVWFLGRGFLGGSKAQMEPPAQESDMTDES